MIVVVVISRLVSQTLRDDSSFFGVHEDPPILDTVVNVILHREDVSAQAQITKL